jgi:TrmH family RNA methyltransferase
MLTKAQETLIRSLQTPKGREKSGLCLVEGEKNVQEAGTAVEFAFARKDTKTFNRLVTTETPQEVAAVARIPKHTAEEIARKPTVIVLDGVQDPGNVGTILRLCLGFRACLVLVECADPASPKVVRSSAGAFFVVPWIEVPRNKAEAFIKGLDRPVYRLERRPSSSDIRDIGKAPNVVLMAGSEGKGIQLEINGDSVVIPHDSALESLNVAQAVAIALYVRHEAAR